LSLPSNYEYFWGEGCPHCAKVDEFLDSWEHADKLELDKKEIYSNRVNSNLLQERGKSCGIPFNQIGVPFVFTPQGECITGDEPIIDFFKSFDFEQ
jgi:glutaredoxin